MKRSIIMGLCLGAVVHLSMELPSSAYDTVVVTDGAVLQGTVTFEPNGAATLDVRFDAK